MPEHLAPAAPARSRLVPIVRELATYGLVALVLFLGFRTTTASFEVDGTSMQPTLHNTDVVLVNKIVYERASISFLGWVPLIGDGLSDGGFLFHGPQRGDVVVFNDPRGTGEQIVKRVIGLPGETVDIKDGYVSIDGRRLTEPYLNVPWFETRPPVVVQEGTYYVMGDNRPASLDSRNLGLIPIDAIVGKAFVTYWPLNRLGFETNILGGGDGPSLEPGADSNVAGVFAAQSATIVAEATPAATPTQQPVTQSFTSRTVVSPGQVARGSTVTATVDITAALSTGVLVDVEFYDARGNKAGQSFYDDVSLVGGETKQFVIPWQVPGRAGTGQYTVKTGVFAPGWSTLYDWNDTAAHFEVQ